MAAARRPAPAVEGAWPPLASDPDAFTTFARDLGADERYRFQDVIDVDAPPKRALAFIVCYPTGGSVAEAILPLFSTPPPPNAAFSRSRASAAHAALSRS